MSDTELTILGDVVTTATDPETQEDVYIKEYVGEGKKYKSPEELAKAYKNADQHIQTLINEKRELEKQLENNKLKNDTLEEIRNSLNGTTTMNTNTQTPTTVSTESLTKEDIVTVVAQIIGKKEAEEQRKRAQEKVWTTLGTAFGSVEQAKEAIKNYAGGDNSKLALLDQMALTDLDGMITLVKAKGTAPQINYTENSQTRTTNPNPSPSGLTWSKCEEVRKSNNVLYRSREFQKAMHDAAAANPNFMKT